MVIFPSFRIVAALLVAVPIAGAAARPAQREPVSAALPFPRSMIADDGHGFVIRSATRPVSRMARSQASFIALGTSLHIDRQLLARAQRGLEETGHAPR
jgi:hypothetical protein